MDTPQDTPTTKQPKYDYSDVCLYWAMVNDDIIKRDEKLEAEFAAGKIKLGTGRTSGNY